MSFCFVDNPTQKLGHHRELTLWDSCGRFESQSAAL